MVSVWCKNATVLFLLLCVVLYCRTETTAFTLASLTKNKQPEFSILPDRVRYTNTAFRMAGVDSEPPKALEEVDLNQVDLTPPKPAATNQKSVDWTVVCVPVHLLLHCH